MNLILHTIIDSIESDIPIIKLLINDVTYEGAVTKTVSHVLVLCVPTVNISFKFGFILIITPKIHVA